MELITVFITLLALRIRVSRQQFAAMKVVLPYASQIYLL